MSTSTLRPQTSQTPELASGSCLGVHSDCHISHQALPQCGFLQFRDAYKMTTANWSLHIVISSLSSLLSSLPANTVLTKHVDPSPVAPPVSCKYASLFAEADRRFKHAPTVDEKGFAQLFKDKANREALTPTSVFEPPIRKPSTQQEECKQQ